MQQGGQYGDVPPQYARPSAAAPSASGNPNPHAHLFNLSHDVAGAGAGAAAPLGLSNNSAPSLSHSGGHLHHAAHSFSLHHHPLQGSVPAQPYHHFQDHLSSHHHHQQSIQSAPSSSHANPQQPQLDHSSPAPSASPAGLHSIHQQSQKHGMVPSVTINVHAGQDAPQLQQSSILQQQYAQQQQQQHSLGLGLESPKPSISSLQQALASRSSASQQQASSTTNITTSTAASSTPTGIIITSSSTSAAPSSMSIQAAPAVAAAPMINSATAAGEPGVAMNLQQLTNSRGLQAVAMVDQAGLQDEGDGLGDEGDKGSGGNRWPRQETLALLKVRSEMDASFRDSSLKRPLWDEVSRKLAELGYQRNAKKCKEKFENVHKYYKRTKEGRAGRQDGKNYRFFSELEALYGNTGTNQARGDLGRSPTSFLLGSSIGAPTRTPDLSARPVNPASFNLRPLIADASGGLNFSSDTSSSDDDNDDEYEDPPDAAPDSKKRKRKSVSRMMAFFENLLKQVIEKQEQMQQRFLDALERREQDRMIREEAWKRQEMARMSREHDLRAQERSLAATRDAAIVAFLQKVTGQTFQLPTTNALAIAAQPVQSHGPPISLNPALDPAYHHIPEDQDPFDPNSKRWPKPEVLALIKLRTGLHSRFIDPGPKGPLWEDIANGMSRLGYNRNAKRCKEKWENINKYFKKAKDSNKNRPENAKTCPYYHQLDALYKQGVLGSSNIANNIKALSYKPSSDNLDGNDTPGQVMQASARGSREGELVAHCSTSADQVLAIMPPTSQLSTASDATASTGNANASANATTVTHLFAATNPDGGDLISKEMNPHPGNDLSPVRAADAKSDIKVVIENPSRLELCDDMSMRPSLQMQRGPDEAQHHRNSSNQGYEHKVDLEQEAGLVEDQEGHQQKQRVLLQQQHTQLQYQQMEGGASGLAQHSSFIANMLQKFSNDPAESNTSTTSTNQEP